MDTTRKRTVRHLFCGDCGAALRKHDRSDTKCADREEWLRDEPTLRYEDVAGTKLELPPPDAIQMEMEI